MNEYYDIDILCQNCDSIILVSIPIGTTTKDYFSIIDNRKCNNCGCEHGRTK